MLTRYEARLFRHRNETFVVNESKLDLREQPRFSVGLTSVCTAKLVMFRRHASNLEDFALLNSKLRPYPT